jgi:polyisoprenoid-binding protein YceI
MNILRILSVTVAVTLSAATLHAAEFVVKAGAPNEVVFTSKATTETFQGKTNKVQGKITFDPASIGDSVTVHIEVDLASLDTGIGKRNQTMRDDYLQTKQYPRAVFEGATLLAGGNRALAADPKFEVAGNFTLHGVTRRLRVTVEITQKDARTLEFKTDFPVTLADYNIQRPKFLFLKLGEVQEVAVTGTAINAQ